MTKAVIYCRFSDRKDAENCQSNETQRDLCSEYCLAKGYDVAGVYLDDAISGAEEDRPILWAAVDSLKRGMVLVVYRADRLARNAYLHHLIYKRVEERKAFVEVVNSDHNGDSPENELVRGILALFAAYERKVIAARTKAASLRHQAAGRAMSKEPPIGKSRVGKALVDNPAELEIVGIILTARNDKGCSYRAIARSLNAAGVACRGKEWHHSGVRRVCQRYSQPAAK
jgi:DNA invertase Pin-like site-specific DNA recombinase